MPTHENQAEGVTLEQVLKAIADAVAYWEGYEGTHEVRTFDERMRELEAA